MEKDVKWYSKKAKDLYEVSPLENQFQNFFVYPLLEGIVSGKDDIKVIDCHNFRQFNTEEHTRCGYSVLVKAVPDLLIAKNFVYRNRVDDGKDNENAKRKSTEIIAAVEVKAPNSNCLIVKSGGNEYKDNLYLQLFPSLYKNKKVIFTNIKQWDFYNREQVQDADLESRLKTYMDILEFCGLDKGDDYESIRQKIMKEKKLLEILNKDQIDINNFEINKKNIQKIVKSVDDTYINDIKDYIQKAKTYSINVTLNVADKNNLEFDEKKIKTLYGQLESFLSL